jgi:small GTP-binding protein
MSKQDYKVVILGASGVGKTCLGLRFVKDQFVNYTASTIGASFLVKELVFNNTKMTMQIWDTAGQERFRSMAPLYYRGAVAAILVFSITDESSFDKLKEWVRELQVNHPADEPLVLAIACNKADLAEQRVVSWDTASQYAESIGALIYETSAKSNTGVLPSPHAATAAVTAARGAPSPSCAIPRHFRSYRAGIKTAVLMPRPDATCALTTGVSQLFTDVARRLVSQKSRTADAPQPGLAPLPDPLAPDSTRRSKCC